MHTTTALKTGATYGGPAVFGAGAAMLVGAVLASGPPHTVAAGPSPTVTVTASTPPVVVLTPRRPSTSSPQPQPQPQPQPPSARAAGSRVVAAGQQSARRPGGSDTPVVQPRPGAGSPSSSGPAPTPTPTVQPAAACSGSVLAVRVLRAACVSVGGSR